MEKQTVIFFDGFCNLCHRAVQFTLKRDPKGFFYFASLQSEYAQVQLGSFAFEKPIGDSFILLEDGKLYQRSTAALKVARRLNSLWPLLYAFIIVPPFIRDAVYNYIAKHRYKWFGQRETCWLPTPALQQRFLS